MNGLNHACPTFETCPPIGCCSRKLIPLIKNKARTYISICCIALSEVMRMWLLVLKSFNLAYLIPKSHLSLVAKPDKWVLYTCQARTCHRLLGASFPKPVWIPYRLKSTGPSLLGVIGNFHRPSLEQNSSIAFLAWEHGSFPNPVLTVSSVRFLH